MPIVRSSLANDNANWPTGRYTAELLNLMDSDDRLIIDGTWFDLPGLTLSSLISDSSSEQIHVITAYDPPPWEDEVPVHNRVHAYHINAYWLFYCQKHLQRHKHIPTEFDNNFLCYMRKPREERKFLYALLNGHDGLVTIGTKKYEFNDTIDKSEHNATIITDSVNVSNDVVTLGNIDIWNSSFLNIVAETVHCRKFVTEKTFKPILGYRPFLIYGNPDINTMLEDWGFELFNHDFGFNPDDDYEGQAHQLNNIVSGLSNTNCVELFNALLPKIEHNYSQYDDIVNTQWHKFTQDIKNFK